MIKQGGILKKTTFLLALSISLFSQDLRELIEMGENNELSKAYQYKAKAADDTLSATYAGYLPNFKAGISRISADKTTAVEPDSVTTTYITASAVIFDGFKRKNLIGEKKALRNSAKYDYSHYKKSLALDITKLYYSLMNIRTSIKATEAKKNALKEELARLEQFYKVGNITQDQLEQIRSAYHQAEYDLIIADVNENEIKESLESLVGTEIRDLKNSKFFFIPRNDENREDVKSLEEKIRSLDHQSEQQTSTYYPTVAAEIGKYNYNYSETIAGAVDEQTKVTLNLKLLEFDFFSKSKAKEAITANKLALENQLAYQKRTIKTDQKVALSKVDAAKKKIESAQLMSKASKIAFTLIDKKRKVGVADNVDYLNALTDKFNAEALLESSKNDYQVAIAEFYYHMGINFKERLQ
ncbi:MAG: TolC family protein [Campylobacterales bacterium]|nr:TolC family protein [Campylobacterales bacterium]